MIDLESRGFFGAIFHLGFLSKNKKSPNQEQDALDPGFMVPVRVIKAPQFLLEQNSSQIPLKLSNVYFGRGCRINFIGLILKIALGFR